MCIYSASNNNVHYHLSISLMPHVGLHHPHAASECPDQLNDPNVQINLVDLFSY